jgi:hypothetical protein
VKLKSDKQWKNIKTGYANLIDHKRLESIRNWIEIIYPPKPGMHVAGRNGKSSINNQGENEHSCWSQGLSQASRKRAYTTEYHRHCHGRSEAEQEEGEEGFRSPSQILADCQRTLENIEFAGRELTVMKYMARLKKIAVPILFGRSQIMEAMASENGW